MRILVTGGAGYIGSHTVVELINKGFEVIIVDNLSNSYRTVLDSIEKITGVRPLFYEFDLCTRSSLISFFEKNKVDAIIHFAAYKSVGESVENPLKYYENNLLSLINLLDVSPKYGVNNIVFSSSCSVYGEPDSLPVHEQTPLKKAESPYANTKKIGEEILMDAVKSSEMRGVSLRYFNPIGAHDTALIGELPIGTPTNLIPVITQTAIGKREVLNVYGDDYDTPDGSCIRDYIHVTDIAKAHIAAVERLINTKSKSTYEVFNLGTGKGNTVLEVIETFERVTGEKLNYKIAPRRAGDVVKIYADTKLANLELGWKTEKGLEEMLLSAWRWEQALNAKEKANV